MKELKNIIISAQNGDKNSMQEIIKTFTPLINKYTKRMRYDEDFKSDLILFMLETVLSTDLSKLKTLNNYTIINYIKTAIYHQFIHLSKKKSNLKHHENHFETEDIEEWLIADDVAPKKEDQILTKDLMKEKLSKREYVCVKLMVIDGLTSTEAAKILKISRQSVNEAKNRGLKKLKLFYEDFLKK